MNSVIDVFEDNWGDVQGWITGLVLNLRHRDLDEDCWKPFFSAFKTKSDLEELTCEKLFAIRPKFLFFEHLVKTAPSTVPSVFVQRLAEFTSAARATANQYYVDHMDRVTRAETWLEFRFRGQKQVDSAELSSILMTCAFYGKSLREPFRSYLRFGSRRKVTKHCCNG